MIAEKATECIEQAVCYELRNIVKKYGSTYNSEHEGYAVLLEEVQEACEDAEFMQDALKRLWTSIRQDELSNFELSQVRGFARALIEEAVQVTAVCERFMETVKKNTEVKSRETTYREDKTIL